MRRLALVLLFLSVASGAIGQDMEAPETFLAQMQRETGFDPETFRWMADAAAEEGLTSPSVHRMFVGNHPPTNETRVSAILTPGSYVLMLDCPTDIEGDGCRGGIEISLHDFETGELIVTGRDRVRPSLVTPFELDRVVEAERIRVTIERCDFPREPADHTSMCPVYAVLWEAPAGWSASSSRGAAGPASPGGSAAAVPPAEQPSVDPAVAFTELVDSYLRGASAVASQQGYGRRVEVFRGSLEQGAEQLVTLSLPETGDYALLGVCDNDCSGLDLTLLDESGNELLDDGAEDDMPVLALDVTEGGTWPLLVRMRACSAAPCYWAAGVYRR